MLPSLGFNEIIILGILALVVVGPKELPLLFRKLGKWTAKLRGMAQEVRTGFDELARQAELDELKREVQALRRTTNLNEIARDLTKPLPTLEDYAGISKPQPAVPERIPEPDRGSSDAQDGASQSGSEDPPSEAAPAQAPALDVPEHADVAPVARSGS
jgi:sec-independent protein translocase protein TatB